ncbi:MAG: hypothetical protein ACTHJM_15770 [Marmoricola sp.]
MARTYAAIKVSIWGNDDFTALSPMAQWLYFHLSSHPTLSLVGVADWRPRKIPSKAVGLTHGVVESAREELLEGDYILIDDDTEEVLVRSFLRHDGCLKRPKMGDAIMSAYADIASRRLKSQVTSELQRLHDESPEYAAFKEGKLAGIIDRAAAGTP